MILHGFAWRSSKNIVLRPKNFKFNPNSENISKKQNTPINLLTVWWSKPSDNYIFLDSSSPNNLISTFAFIATAENYFSFIARSIAFSSKRTNIDVISFLSKSASSITFLDSLSKSKTTLY